MNDLSSWIRGVRAPRLLALGVLALALSARSASADFMYDVSTPINGTVPLGTLQAKFVDKSAGVVELTMISKLSSSPAGQFIQDWGFNVVSTFSDYSHLSISQVSKTNATYADTATASEDQKFDPASIGKFDLIFTWKGSNHGFGPGGKVVYDITYSGTGTFDAATFIAQSAGGSVPLAPFYTAAKIAGIPPGGASGELGNTEGPTPLTPTPEPGSLVLCGMGVGVLGLVGLRRRMRTTARA